MQFVVYGHAINGVPSVASGTSMSVDIRMPMINDSW